MDAWRHHQRQVQQQKASSPMYRTGGQYAVSGMNVTPSDGDSYNLSAVEQCCTDIHPPPPLKRQYNLQAQQTPVGHLSEQVVVPYAPQLEQQFFSGFNPSFVRECRRTVSSEYVIKYKDGTALKAGFSYHEPSCKCQECVARFFPDFDNKKLASVSAPPYLGDKNVYVQEAVFPKRAGISDERYIPVQSSFSKPAGINSEGCVPMQTVVSKPSVRSYPEHITMLSGVSEPTDFNSKGCVMMQTEVSKPYVCSDLERVAMSSGVSNPTDIDSEGCGTMQSKASNPSVRSDSDQGAMWSDVSSIRFRQNVSEHPGASKPAMRNDSVSVIRLWKPPDADSIKSVPKQSSASVPADLSNQERHVEHSNISDSKELSNQGYHIIPSNLCISSRYIDRETLEQSEASKTSNRECLTVEPTGKCNSVDGLTNQQVYDSQTEPAGKEKFYHRTQSYEQLAIRTVANAEEVEGEKPFKCAVCSMSFASKTWWSRHYFSHGPVPCKICNKPLLSMSTLNAHMAEHRRKRKKTVRSSISKSKGLSNESSLIIPSNVNISGGHIDRDTFVEQSKASEISNGKCLTEEPTDKGCNVDGSINQRIHDQQTELAVKEKVYHRTQSHELFSSQILTNAEKVNGDKPFKCAKCSMAFTSEAWLGRHSFVHGPVHCRICDKPLSVSTLKEHMAEHRKKEKKITESSISTSQDLSNESSLIQSIVSILTDQIARDTFAVQSKASEISNGKSLTVEPTDKGCNVDGSINQQIHDQQTELAVKEKAYHRTQSHELLSNKTMTNVQEVEGDKPFKCSKCSLAFASKTWWRRHSFSHSPVHCKICNKPFLSIFKLKSHMAEHRRKRKKIAQPSISKSKGLSNESSLIIPSNVNISSGHIDRDTFMEQSKASEISNGKCLTVEPAEKGCNVDGLMNRQICDQQTELAVKEKAHHRTKTFQCRICGKIFLSHRSWNGHMTKHRKERKCNVYSLINQQIHDQQTELALKEKVYHRTQSHELLSNKTMTNVEEVEGDKPFKCSKCSLAFASKTWWRRHSFSHGPVHCKICNKPFLSISTLKAHMAEHRRKRNKIARSSIPTSKCLSNESSLIIPSNVSVSSGHIDRDTFMEQSKASEISNGKCLTVEPAEKRCNVDGLMNRQICDQQTELAVKEKAHHRTKTFQCRICGKTFLSHPSWNGHMTKHRKERKRNVDGLINQQLYEQQTELAVKEKAYRRTKTFQCRICGKTFLSHRSWNGHMTKHRKGRKRIYKCRQCAEVYFSPFAAYKHKLSHKEDNFQCNVCNEPFGTYSEYLAHVNVHRTPQKSPQPPKRGRPVGTAVSFACDQCDKMYSRKTFLNKHKLSHNRKRLECDLCNKVFKFRSEMKRHMETHTNSTTHCQECNIVCTSIMEYNDHLKTHQQTRRFKCVLCGSFFLTKHALAGHLMQHKQPREPKELQEPQEPKEPQEPTEPQDLKESQESTEPQELKEPQEPIFKCSQCNKQYATKRTLHVHMLSHSQTKYYKCKECNKRFTSKHKLRTHEDIHFEVKTFHCSICRKGFSTNCGLEGHMKAHRKTFFSCAECDATFERDEDLKEHALTHPKDRSSKCMVCDLLFRATELFRCNLISSEEEAPFECLLCEVCFNNNITNAQDRPSAV